MDYIRPHQDEGQYPGDHHLTPIAASPVVNWDEREQEQEHGFTSTFGTSAGSRDAGAGTSSEEDQGDYFVSALGDETAMEEDRQRGRGGAQRWISQAQGREGDAGGMMDNVAGGATPVT